MYKEGISTYRPRHQANPDVNNPQLMQPEFRKKRRIDQSFAQPPEKRPVKIIDLRFLSDSDSDESSPKHKRSLSILPDIQIGSDLNVSLGFSPKKSPELADSSEEKEIPVVDLGDSDDERENEIRKLKTKLERTERSLKLVLNKNKTLQIHIDFLEEEEKVRQEQQTLSLEEKRIHETFQLLNKRKTTLQEEQKSCAARLEMIDKKSAAQECKVCYDAKTEYAFLPCGHLCICANCKEEYDQDTCLVCRKKITSFIRIYS